MHTHTHTQTHVKGYTGVSFYLGTNDNAKLVVRGVSPDEERVGTCLLQQVESSALDSLDAFLGQVR